MPRNIVDRREISLPELPEGSQSSLRVVDLVHNDGSVRRLWQKDDGIQVFGLTPHGMVVAITERGYTHLVGGYVEPGESPGAAARREFLEETGYEAESWGLLARFLQDSGGSERTIWFYLATGCHGVQDGEAGIRVKLISPSILWKLLTGENEEDPNKGRRGLMSLATTALAFQKLGLLTVS